MGRKFLIATSVVVLLAVASIWGLYIYYWKPKAVVSKVLDSYPNEPWMREYIKDRIILVAFDENTKDRFGYNEGTFRDLLTYILPVLYMQKPRAIMIDASFENNLTHDRVVQKALDQMNGYAVWADSSPRRSVFTRRTLRTLPLGHTNLTRSTLANRKLELIELCRTERGGAVPALALLTFEISYGVFKDVASSCRGWIKGAPFKTYDSFRETNDLEVNFDYEKIPMFTDKNDKEYIPIRYMGPEGFFERISFVDVLSAGMSPEKMSWLKNIVSGKIVLGLRGLKPSIGMQLKWAIWKVWKLMPTSLLL